jgi:hypothetical protein
MFIATLFTIAKLWRKSRYPTTDKWIKKMWYRYNIILIVTNNNKEKCKRLS